ncbi:MAG: hypothetical protein NC099_00620 [Corallococcus sp.]|nr:hypothetical protein [Corallococcus sp.]
MKKQKMMTRKISLTVFFATVIALCIFGLLLTQIIYGDTLVMGETANASDTPPVTKLRLSTL